MRIAVIGLGRMGANISRRLMRGGHEVVAFDRDPANVRQLQSEGAAAASSLEEAASLLEPPRIFWLMVPAGAPTEDTVTALLSIAQAGDVGIDGGNSFFKDDVRRFASNASSCPRASTQRREACCAARLSRSPAKRIGC